MGDGVQGQDYRGGGAGKTQRVSSPWDCVLIDTGVEKSLYVAMSGLHQIWKIDLDGPSPFAARNFSGTGYERNQNGPNGATSSWAQPSGLTTVPGGGALLVADSESSSIRRLDLATGGASGCVGGDPLFSDNLFRFGDADGVGTAALLQHPLGLAAASDGKIYVADSYNHKLKVLDPSTCSITTLIGTGSAGFEDGILKEARLSEPGGLVVSPFSGGKVFIADTNNSSIRMFDPEKKTLSTLRLEGVPRPRVSPDISLASIASTDDAFSTPPGALVISSTTQATLQRGCLSLRITLPPGYHLTSGANSSFECLTPVAGVAFTPKRGALQEDGSGGVGAVVTYDSTASSGDDSATEPIRILCSVYFCRDRAVCLFQDIVFVVERTLAAGGSFEIQLTAQLSPQAPEIQLPGGM